MSSKGKDFIKVGYSTCGIAAGADKVYSLFKQEIKRRNLTVELKKCGCVGMCYAEPVVEVKTKGLPAVIYGEVKEDTVMGIIEKHIVGKRLVNDHIYSIRVDDSDLDNSPKILLRDTDSQGEDKTKDYYGRFLDILRSLKLETKVQVVRVADIGVYNKGVVVRIVPEDIIITNIQLDQIEQIINQVIVKKDKIASSQIPAEKYQLRIVLRNCGVIDPESIEDYLSVKGYKALEKALGNSPEEIIEELRISGLRGRGGAGFPTWMKWNFARSVKSDVKYIICNGDEGDPGAYMDRSVLEGDPHSVIEGMIIAGYVVGSKQGYCYIRAEYPLAIERVQKAIDQAYEKGFLGKNILGKNFDFDLEIRLGAGAFVCGEETALIASVEGKRGYPRPRPPYPSVQGLWDKPTVINNVETLANIPAILLNGGEWFSKIGLPGCSGTKVFALTGKVKKSGLIEVPMGTTLYDIVYHIGGGIVNNKKLKAVQTGGPSGGVIPEDFLNIPVGYESLQKLGSIMGSGGMIVMDEDDCMVDIAKFYLGFCVDESCGKCAPCRIGGKQMLNILGKISEGKAQEEDLTNLERICKAMNKASLCGLGQTAPNPVISTLKYFRDEYIAHIKNRHCPAGKCVSLFNYEIIPEKCKRCGVCFRNCPVHAIKGNREKGYIINPDECIRCGHCYEVCKFNAIKRG